MLKTYIQVEDILGYISLKVQNDHFSFNALLFNKTQFTFLIQS